MVNQINDPANDNYNFGLDFDYSLWTPGTRVDLVNVPWNNDYRDTVSFADRAAVDTYIDGRAPAGITIEQMSYLKPNEPVRVNIPHNRALRYNYLRATNPNQPISPNDVLRNYYYFILDVKYIAPNTTELILQLDLWATYLFDVEFGNCYAERGHVAIANRNQFKNYGRDYLTVPEGLDIGSELRIVDFDSERTYSNIDSEVVVFSTVNLILSGGTTSNPQMLTANGGMIHGLPSGASAYRFDSAASFSTWLIDKQAQPWITQGIISASMIPRMSKFGLTGTLTPNVPNKIDGGSVGSNKILHRGGWRQTFEDVLGVRYKHLKKFLTFPYTSVEMTYGAGHAVLLKPELIRSNNFRTTQYLTINPPGQKLMAVNLNYNSPEDDKESIFGDALSMGTSLGSFPTLAVVNNMALSYLASNKNSIAYQRGAADWTQQRAMGMSQAQYDMSSGAINAMGDLTNIGVGADRSQTAISNNLNWHTGLATAIGGIASGGAGGALAGPAGIAAGTLQGGIQSIVGAVNVGSQMSAANESLATRSGAAFGSLDVNQNQSRLVRDTNKSVADWAAKGDYANAIAGINAKVQDANMIQPGISGQMGGEALNFVNELAYFMVKYKMIDDAAIRVIGEYWLRYGYAIRAFIKPPKNLQVMTKFSYWKMLETYIASSSIPEGHKQGFRGILEKGVTVWNDPNDIGMIDIADNEPITGEYY